MSTCAKKLGPLVERGPFWLKYDMVLFLNPDICLRSDNFSGGCSFGTGVTYSKSRNIRMYSLAEAIVYNVCLEMYGTNQNVIQGKNLSLPEIWALSDVLFLSDLTVPHCSFS